MAETGAPRPKINIRGVVRDKNGKPKFDKPELVRPGHWAWDLLTEEEQKELSNGHSS